MNEVSVFLAFQRSEDFKLKKKKSSYEVFRI